ncbi:MAG: hypothetical protein P9L92_03470 [Candidatus Electryonea clarkiae]|nr:hypothetical protein [Candidatus Electryonea clarkiae]MDP8285949.1 hypothetical protein [Candidatus Electryonea clarkiae]
MITLTKKYRNILLPFETEFYSKNVTKLRQAGGIRGEYRGFNFNFSLLIEVVERNNKRSNGTAINRVNQKPPVIVLDIENRIQRVISIQLESSDFHASKSDEVWTHYEHLAHEQIDNHYDEAIFNSWHGYGAVDLALAALNIEGSVHKRWLIEEALKRYGAKLENNSSGRNMTPGIPIINSLTPHKIPDSDRDSPVKFAVNPSWSECNSIEHLKAALDIDNHGNIQFHLEQALIKWKINLCKEFKDMAWEIGIPAYRETMKFMDRTLPDSIQTNTVLQRINLPEQVGIHV